MGVEPEATGRLLNESDLYLQTRGEFVEARDAVERALTIDEKVDGKDHPQVAIYANNLGTVLQDLGDFEGAKKCHARALKIFQDKLGEGHPHTVKARNNLAALEREMKGEG